MLMELVMKMSCYDQKFAKAKMQRSMMWKREAEIAKANSVDHLFLNGNIWLWLECLLSHPWNREVNHFKYRHDPSCTVHASLAYLVDS